jgi:hypothetical protein
LIAHFSSGWTQNTTAQIWTKSHSASSRKLDQNERGAADTGLDSFSQRFRHLAFSGSQALLKQESDDQRLNLLLFTLIGSIPHIRNLSSLVPICFLPCWSSVMRKGSLDKTWQKLDYGHFFEFWFFSRILPAPPYAR